MAVTGTLARRGLLANKWRLALTALAVVLGVSFVSGSFMLRDSLNTAFSNLVTQANHGIDAQVRTKLLFGDTSARNPVPPQLLTAVQHVNGVAAAAGTVGQIPVTIIGKDGKAKTPGAAPTIGLAWIDDAKLTSLHLAAGRRPHGIGEVAIDKQAAEKTGYKIGESMRVVLPTGARNFHLVGTFRFGTSDSLAGAYLVGFDPTVASQLLGLHGYYEAIDVRAVPGVSAPELAARLNAVLPRGYEAIDNAKLNQEAKDNFGFINAIATGLLAFALIALFVSGFIINNTFAILASQRLRELGLLRALGGSARQVRVLMFVEALVVGVSASIIGIGAGVLIELGIRALISALGGGLPGTFVLTPTPIIWGFAVGIIVTMAAALTPAFRAGRIPPVAAMSAEHTATAEESKWRLAIPAGFAVAGVVAFLVGLFSRPGSTAEWLALAGLGAALLFVGVAGLARLVVRPVLVAVSAVLRPVARVISYAFTVAFHRARQRIVGQIARDNTSRTPRRTSAAAAALMIGLAFVTVGSVLGASIKKTLKNQLHTSITADLFIQDNTSFRGMPSAITAGIAKVPGVTDVSGFRGGSFKYANSEKNALFADHTTAVNLVDIKLKSGSWSGLGLNKVFVYTDPANQHHLHVGFHDAGPVPVGPAPCAHRGRYLRRLEHRRQLPARPVHLRAELQRRVARPVCRHARPARPLGERGQGLGGHVSRYRRPRRHRAEPPGVPAVAGESGQPVLRADQRAAVPRRRDRVDWYRQHAGAVGVRTDPRARLDARRRHGAHADKIDGALGVGAHRGVRCATRNRARCRARRPRRGRVAVRSRVGGGDPGWPAVRVRGVGDRGRHDRGLLPGAARREDERARRHRQRVAVGTLHGQ